MDCALLALCLVYTITLKVFLYIANAIELKIGGMIMLEMMLSKLQKPIIIPVGQQDYTVAGTYSWVCPDDVFMVCVAMVAGGQAGSSIHSNNGLGGKGGGLRWCNNIPVVPGQTYGVVVGSGGTTVTKSYSDTIPITGGGNSGAFNIVVGVGNAGTAMTADIRGYNGCIQPASANAAGKTAYGGDSASYTASAPNKYDTANSLGLVLSTGAMAGNGAGKGGIMVGPAIDNGGYPKTAYKGGDGAVRIIWGKNRAFPSTNITNK